MHGSSAVRPRRAQPGRLAVLEGPAAQRELVFLERRAPLGPADLERPLGVGQEHRHLGPEDLREVARRDRDERVDVSRRRELTAHGVERRSSLLALASRLRLPADAGRQPADDEPHDQHHREGQQVLRVRDDEREVGRDEEEVEGRDAHDGGDDGGPPPIPGGDGHDGEQVRHDQVGRLEEREHQPGEAGRERDGGDRLRIAGDDPPARRTTR